MTDAVDPAPEGVVVEAQVDTPSPVENRPPEAPPAPEKEQPAEKAPEKPKSVRESLEKAVADLKAKAAADKSKAEGGEKASDDSAAKPDASAKDRTEAKDQTEAKETAKSASKSAAEKPATGREGAEPRPSEGRKGDEPPARFLPGARDSWRNVPHEVRAEFHRVSGEYERELKEHREYRENLREYESLAKQHGVTVKDTMARYVAADRALNADFGRGVAELAKSYGHSPQSAVAAVLRGFGVTPQQYAQMVAQNPQAHAVQQRQQPQVSPDQIAQRAAEMAVQSMQSQIRQQETQGSVDRFAESHPDFEELQGQIAEILRSGVVEKLYGAGLSPDQVLAQAYRMAGGSPSHPDPAQADSGHPAAKPAHRANPAGRQSISGAPATGTHPTSGQKPSPTIRAALERAARQHGL